MCYVTTSGQVGPHASHSFTESVRLLLKNCRCGWKKCRQRTKTCLVQTKMFPLIKQKQHFGKYMLIHLLAETYDEKTFNNTLLSVC